MTSWLPLESNPDDMTRYIHKLGVPEDWSLTDVVGLDPEMLEWVPKPVKAVILLFPCTEAYEKHRAEEEQKLCEEEKKCPDDLFYLKQVIHNACGTIALVHSIANNSDIVLKDGVLKKFLEDTKTLNPEERGKILEKDTKFTESHQDTAYQGQTPVEPDVQTIHHYIALVNKHGVLYELDGRKSCPVKHGNTNEESFLQDAAKICKEFMARDPDEVRFTVIALTPTQK